MSVTLRVLRREAARMAARPSLFVLTVVTPLAAFVLLGAVYRHAVIETLPVAVVDADRSALSRQLARGVDATPALTVVAALPSVEAVREAMRRGEVEGAFVFPAGLEASVKAGRAAHVVLYKNSASYVAAGVLTREGATLVRTVSAGVVARRMRAQGLSEAAARRLAAPVRVETHVLFNPGFNYQQYLSPALMAMLLQMVVMLSAVALVSTERREGTFAALAEAAGGRAHAVLAGKTVPYLLVHGAVALALLGLVFPAFDIAVAGSLAATTLFLLYFVAAAFFPAFLLSCLVDDPLLATEVVVFLNTPAFLFSGYTFPVRAMPGLHAAFAEALPYTPFLDGFVRLYQYGAPVAAVGPEVLKLSLFLWPSLLGAAWVLHRRLRPYRVAAP